MTEAVRASEIGHWYTKDAIPAYTVIGANGKERPTTLRDARKMQLAPSVTTVLKAAAKPGLERWKAEQLLMAALTLPKIEEEAEVNWIARVWEDSAKQAQAAAARGTEIHAAIEAFFGRGEEPSAEMKPYVDGAAAQITRIAPIESWLHEKSFVSQLGYGGKVDLHTARDVYDIKTKDGDLSDVKCYEDHFMQVAAYAMGLDRPEASCGILFVSRTHAGLAKTVSFERHDTLRGWDMFRHLLAYWQASNDYRPAWSQEAK